MNRPDAHSEATSDSPPNTPAGELLGSSSLGFDLREDAWLDLLRGYHSGPGPGRIGPYELLEEIGRGGQGVVYKARQPRTNRIIAIKRVLASGLDGRSFRVRFEREIRATSALDHPHIVSVLGCEDIQGQPILLMEYIEGVAIDCWAREGKDRGESGGDERAKVASGEENAKPGTRGAKPESAGARDLRAIVTTFGRLSRAVAHAHQRGIIHRDLKPSNVLIDPEGNPHVLDFGLARLLHPLLEDSLFRTHTAGFVGTPIYASPEHFDDDESAVDVRSDVYAVGVMLYQAMTGELPQGNATRFSTVMRAIQEREPQRPSRIRAEVDGELEAIVLKALAKERKDRYQTMDALAEDLERYLAGEAVLAHPPTMLYQLRKLVRRHKLAFASVLTILILVIAFAVTASTLAMREARARQRAELQAYIAALAGAEASLEAYNVTDARRSLEQAPQQLRNWEWRLLAHRLDESTDSLPTGSTVYGLDYHPSGELLAAACRDGAIRVWNPRTHEMITKFDAGAGILTDLRFSPNGALLAVCGVNKITRLFEVGSWRALATLRGHEQRVNALAFSPNGRFLATAGGDHSILLCSIDLHSEGETATVQRTLPNPVLQTATPEDARSNAGEASVSFSPDGRFLAACWTDGKAWLWDLDKADDPTPLPSDGKYVTRVAFSPDGQRLLLSCSDGCLVLCTLPPQGEPRLLRGHRGEVFGIDFSSDGSMIASCGWDLTLRLWDARSSEQKRLCLGFDENPQRIRFSPDGRQMATGGGDASVKLWSVEDPDYLYASPQQRTGARRVLSAAVSPTNPWMIVSRASLGADGGLVCLADTEQRTELVTLHRAAGGETSVGHPLELGAVGFSPDGRFAAAESGEGSILVWATDSFTQLKSLRLQEPAAPQPRLRLQDVGSASGSIPTQMAHALAFSPEGRLLAVGSHERRSILVWNIQEERVVRTLEGHAQGVTSLATDVSGLYLASGCQDGTIMLWDWGSGAALAILTGHQGDVPALAFQPNGRLLASAAHDKTLKLWDVERKREVMTLTGHTAEVFSLAFSPDGSRLASGSADRTIRIWDPATGQNMVTLHGHSYLVSSVAFTPDGRYLVSGSADGTIRFWDAGSRAADTFPANGRQNTRGE